MCPPECRNVVAHVDVFGRAHRPSPTVAVNVVAVNVDGDLRPECRNVNAHGDVYRADAGVRPYSCG